MSTILVLLAAVIFGVFLGIMLLVMAPLWILEHEIKSQEKSQGPGRHGTT